MPKTPFHLPGTAFDLAVFPQNYRDARARLYDLFAQLPGSLAPSLLSFRAPRVGLDGEDLYSDAIWLGPTDAESVIVLSSGTHGIEGFAGTAIQLDLLGLLAQREVLWPQEIALLLIHALTPWGYSWQRRCDHDGVDLNRNAIDFAAPPENPGYTALREALHDADRTYREQVFAAWRQQHGQASLEAALSAGQYDDPSGPFYGGRRPAHGRLVTEALIDIWQLATRQLAVIDLHSGLGAFGYGEVICDHPLDSAGTRQAHAWYGDAVTLPSLGTSSSVPKFGLIDYLWHAVMNEYSSFVTLEFGTYPTACLFEVLLDDHRIWAQGDDAAKEGQRAAMRHHFCPEDRGWREMVLWRARQVISQAVCGLAHDDD